MRMINREVVTTEETSGVVFRRSFPYVVATILVFRHKAHRALSAPASSFPRYRSNRPFRNVSMLFDGVDRGVATNSVRLSYARNRISALFPISFRAWIGGESCRCYGDYVSPGFVALLDIALIVGCIGYVRSHDARSMDARFSPASMLLGAMSGSVLFLILVFLSTQNTPFKIASAWDEESLVGRDINRFIQLDEQRIVPSVDEYVVIFLYDTGCPICLEHWRQTNDLPDREARFPHAIAIWRLKDHSWVATDFASQPASSVNQSVSFPSGIPYLSFPAMIEVKDSKIVNVQTTVE